MKKLFLILGIISFCLAFSGCTVFETDTEALMTPPVFTEEQEKLNLALTEVIGEEYTLKYPKNGEINSAFVFKDLDGDGTEEAMAFYSVLEESTRINILKKTEEGWLSVYEAAGFFGDIESIEFVDIDKENPVLVVKWEQEMRIYRYKKERLETIHTANCEGYAVTDIDKNGFDEIVTFAGTAGGRTSVNLIYSAEDVFTVTDNVNINAEYGKIYSIKTGALVDGTEALFLDSTIYDGVFLTEVITLEKGKIKRHFLSDFIMEEEEKEDESVKENTGVVVVVIGTSYGKRGIYLRNTKVSCMDINGDGITEFPVEVREDYAQEASETVFYIEYMQYNGDDDSVPVWHGIANTEKGYFFSAPHPWNARTEIITDHSGDELVIVDTERNMEIFKICAVLKSDYQDKYEDYILAAETETTNYYVKSFVGEGDIFYIAPETYKDLFIFI